MHYDAFKEKNPNSWFSFDCCFSVSHLLAVVSALFSAGVYTPKWKAKVTVELTCIQGWHSPEQISQKNKKIQAQNASCCWWFRNPKQPPFGCVKPIVKNGINYQPQLVSMISEPSTVLKKCKVSFNLQTLKNFQKIPTMPFHSSKAPPPNKQLFFRSTCLTQAENVHLCHGHPKKPNIEMEHFILTAQNSILIIDM